MKVTHKLLTTGYHHVRAIGYAHLFAQWPVGVPVSTADVSYGEMYPGADTIFRFCEAADRAAAKSVH